MLHIDLQTTSSCLVNLSASTQSVIATHCGAAVLQGLAGEWVCVWGGGVANQLQFAFVQSAAFLNSFTKSRAVWQCSGHAGLRPNWQKGSRTSAEKPDSGAADGCQTEAGRDQSWCCHVASHQGMWLRAWLDEPGDPFWKGLERCGSG